MKLPAEYVMEKYKDKLFRAAFSVSRNPQDAEDVVQDTLLQYMYARRDFASEEHVKAWLLRTAINRAKNLVMSFWRRNRLPLEDYVAELAFEMPEDRALVEAVLALPQKYRTVLHLYYYEDCSVSEVGELLRLSASAVKSRLLRGRRMLKEALKEEWRDDE